MYEVRYTDKAQADIVKLKRSEPNSFKKVVKLLTELALHPRTGTGKPEPLTGDRSGQWSRRITQKHRLVYEIHDTEVVVLVLTAYGHYEDEKHKLYIHKGTCAMSSTMTTSLLYHFMIFLQHLK